MPDIAPADRCVGPLYPTWPRRSSPHCRLPQTLRVAGCTAYTSFEGHKCGVGIALRERCVVEFVRLGLLNVVWWTNRESPFPSRSSVKRRSMKTPKSHGACRFRFFYGVFPRCSDCPLFDGERAIRGAPRRVSCIRTDLGTGRRETSKRGPPPPEQRHPARPLRRETFKRCPTRAGQRNRGPTAPSLPRNIERWPTGDRPEVVVAFPPEGDMNERLSACCAARAQRHRRYPRS